MESDAPRLPVDLSRVRTNGGVGYAHTGSRDHYTAPDPGSSVVAVGDDGETLEAVVDRALFDGTIVLRFDQFTQLPVLRVDLELYGTAGFIETSIPWHLIGRLEPGERVVVPGGSSDDRVFAVVAVSDTGRDVRLELVPDP